MRPTLHLTNLSSTKRHGPGRKVCAMAWPRSWEFGDGICSALAPAKTDLLAIKGGSISLDDYRARFEARLQGASLSPGALRLDAEDGTPGATLSDGDTAFCACARPGSPSRRTPCHLEIAVPFLVAAGWDVLLDGDRVTMGAEGPVWAEWHSWGATDGEGRPCNRYRRPGEPYSAEDFGWPTTT